MNKLSVDQIGFIKKRIEKFIDLPTSPKRHQFHESKDLSSSKHHQNKHRDGKSKSQKKVQINQSPKKNKNSKKQSKNGNQQWIKMKQKQIEDFINHQNRNQVSVFNKFLHSQKIHLKKRQEVEPGLYRNSKDQQDFKDELNESKNFSFDHQLSDLKKAYKNVNSVLDINNEYHEDQYFVQRKEKEQPILSDQNNFSRLLKKIQSDVSLVPKVPQKPQKAETNILALDILVKPSTIRGKTSISESNQIETPRLATLQSYSQKNNQKNNKNQNSHKPGILIKSNSSLSLEKRQRSPYKNRGSEKQKEKKGKKSTVQNKGKNIYRTLLKNQSHKSFEHYFDDENVSSIRQTSSKRETSRQKRMRNSKKLSDSDSKSFLSLSRKKFPASVYRKSFKENPYGVSNQQKFSINKYKKKDISPDERKGLKQKYELLDKRLEKILNSLKTEKEAMNSIQYEENLAETPERHKKSMIPEEILAYQKLSPLRKFLAVNKDLRDHGQTQR